MPDHSKFSTDLKALGFNVDVSDLIEKLDTDQLLNLLDAIGSKNRDAIRQIIGTENESEHDDDGEKDVEAKDEGEEDEEAPLNSLLRKKEHLQADEKDQKNKRILRKSTDDEESNDDIIYNIGDNVAVDGEEATVKIPHAPGNTVGVLINGELKMVDKKKVHKLDEGVLGMTDMPGLKRMQELAGIPSRDNPVSMPHEYPADDMGLGGEVREGEFGDDMGHDDMGMDASHDDFDGEADLPGVGDEMGAPLPPAVPGTPEVPAAPLSTPLAAGPVPMGPMGGMGGIPDTGSALEDAAALDQAISEIEALIPNVKLSNYKQVVARLEALVALAKSTGKAALAESRETERKREYFKNHPSKRYEAGIPHEEMTDTHPEEHDLVPYKRRPGSGIEEDRLSTIRNARDIVAKGGEEHGHDDDEQEDVDSENVPGRKTLMDYMQETEDFDLETLGANRADAVRSLQARMGAGTTPQDAGAAFDAMMKDGGIKQRGSAFQMTPMSDAQVKVDTGAVANPNGNSMANSTATSSSVSGTNTSNPGANVQGSSNSSYQGQ